MKRFKEFIIESKPFNSDLLTGILWELNLTGINEEGDTLILYAEESQSITKQIVESKLIPLIDNNLINSFSVIERIIEDKNWNEAWEKQLDIIKVSERIIIKPPWKEYTASPDQIVITIEPKMSFGTGEHETTKLVLILLEKYIKPGDFMLDFGSGTGILAIAAVKLGAERAIGIDNDEWCLLNGLENIKVNTVHDKVEIRQTGLNDFPEKNFSLITANINKNILIDNSKTLCEKLVGGGTLILSGLLWSDEEMIINEYESRSFEILESISFGEWIALVLKKKE